MKVSRAFRTALGALALVGLAGCETMPIAENAATLDVSFAWPKNAQCFGHSPQFQIGNIPKGTKYLEFNMRDLNATYRHGGGTVEYTGSSTIPEGALKSYQGPCPPSGAHTYEFTVKAVNAEKNLVLGQGVAKRKFPE